MPRPSLSRLGEDNVKLPLLRLTAATRMVARGILEPFGWSTDLDRRISSDRAHRSRDFHSAFRGPGSSGHSFAGGWA
jgi:hypothetical protein